jgi:hypothetical protein
MKWTDWGEPYTISVRKPYWNEQVLRIVLIINNNIKKDIEEEVLVSWR